MKKSDFFKSSPLKTADVEVEGGAITLRELTAGQHDEILDLQKGSVGTIDFLCRLIVMSARDGGEAMFVMDDLPKMREMPLTALKKLSDTILELSGIDEKKDDSASSENDSTS